MKQLLKEWREFIAEEDNLEQNTYSFDFDNTLIRYNAPPPLINPTTVTGGKRNKKRKKTKRKNKCKSKLKNKNNRKTRKIHRK